MNAATHSDRHTCGLSWTLSLTIVDVCLVGAAKKLYPHALTDAISESLKTQITRFLRTHASLHADAVMCVWVRLHKFGFHFRFKAPMKRLSCVDASYHLGAIRMDYLLIIEYQLFACSNTGLLYSDLP